MALVSRAFADQRREEIFRKGPQAVTVAAPAPAVPWQSISSGEMPPLMLQFRLRSGETISYSYHDIREIRVRDAGRVQLGLIGMFKLQVTIEGRHLRELGELIASGLVRWMQETDERSDEAPETSPCITSIAIERISSR